MASAGSAEGELVQWDTLNPDWLEGRGEPVCYLVRMIDDATSRSEGRFVQHDSTRESMGELWQYLERKGRMVDVHRPLTPQIDLTRALSHVEPRVVSNDYTFSFAGRRYQIARSEVKGGMRGKSLNCI